MLAEKYRPRDFSQIIGQGKATQALKYCLDGCGDTGKVFLLTGPSGCGKTSLAYCAAAYWGVPAHGIHKIEAAECDVAALREVADHVRIYGPGHLGRKCYVIDEIHTVTGRALDLCLSLFEGLPAHVCIFGTTTETDWSTSTLLSRFARIDLQKIPAALVAEQIERVALAEGLPIPADAGWAAKLVKYQGVNLRDQLNQLPARLFGGLCAAA